MAVWSRTASTSPPTLAVSVSDNSCSKSYRSTEAAGIWTIQTGIFPENESSIYLHQRVGFEIVGRRKRLGRLHGSWRDVLLLERRSDTVGLTNPTDSRRKDT